MCVDPITAAAIVAATASIAQGVQGYMQGKAQGHALGVGANQALAEGYQSEARQRRLNDAILGNLVTQQGGSGVSSSSPSSVALQDRQAAEAELQALDLRYSGLGKATDLRNQASFARAQGTGALIGGFANAAGALLTSGIGGGLFSKGPIGMLQPSTAFHF